MAISIDYNKKTTKVAFLGMMLLFAFGAQFVVESLKNSVQTSVTLRNQETISQVLNGTIYAQQSQYQPQPYVGTTPTAEEPQDEGTVLSAASGGNGCTSVNPQGCTSETIGFQPVCSSGEAPVGLDGGGATDNGNGSVTIRKNSVVEIWKVTSPLAIMSGNYSMTDSSYTITNDDPAFRSAGNLIDQDYVAGAYATPGEGRERYDSVYNNADTEDFSVHVSANLGADVAGAGGGDTATIFKELDSKCGDIQPSDPNPDRTNKISRELVQSYAIPGEPVQPRNYGTEGCLYINPSEVDLPNSDVFETCVDQRSPFDGIVGAFMNVSQWAECVANPGACAEVELVGLIIDAPFGSNQTCQDGFCADQFYDNSVAARTAPTDMANYTEVGLETANEPILQAHYVTTPCKVRIDYKDVFDIPCLWDVSPYWAEYQQQRQTTPPGSDFPTWEEYWSAVELAAERRGAVCGI